MLKLHLSRRCGASPLSRLGGLFIALCLPATSVCAELDGDTLYRDVRTYSDLGEHRTGTESDLRTSAWLTDELQQLGFDVQRQAFELLQYFPQQAQVSIGETTVDAFPHWLPPQGEFQLSARLAAIASDKLAGRIAWQSPIADTPWHRLDVSALAQQAAEAGAVGLIVAVPHPSGAIYARNAAEPFLQSELPLPTLIVAAKDAGALDSARINDESVTLQLRGETRRVKAVNVLARLDRGGDSVVISTPSSGWFRAAGERGPGVALWLGLARWVAANPGSQSYVFVANSGHELSYMGAHHAMKLLPPPEQVRLWLHLGASIGTRQWREEATGAVPLEAPETSIRLFAHKQWLPAVQSLFQEVPGLTILPGEILPPGRGELVEYLQAGYTAIGFVGAHHYFHTPLDLPEVTSAALLEPYGKALRGLLESINATGSQGHSP